MALLTNMLLGVKGNLKQFDKNAITLSFQDQYIGSLQSNLAGGILKSMSRKIRPKIKLRRDFLDYAEANKLMSIANDMSAFKLLKIDDALEIIDEQRYSVNSTTVKLQASSREWITLEGVWLKTDPHHEGTNYYVPYWDVEYEANELPESATPSWTKSESTAGGTNTEEIIEGKLHIVSPSGSHIEYKRTEASMANATGTTIEAMVKIKKSVADAHLVIDDDVYCALLRIYEGRIQVYQGSGDNAYYMNTTDDYHKYRMTSKLTSGGGSSDVKVYVDDKLVIETTITYVYATGKNIYFGIPGNYADAEAYFDWVYYRIDGIFPPYFDPDTKTLTLTSSLPTDNVDVLVNYKYCGWKVNIIGAPVRLSSSGLFWMLDMNLEGV